MLFKPNPSSGLPIYLQLMEQVKYGIETGALRPGEELPGIRRVAVELVVNPNTVAKAYRDLEVMGLLYTRRGMGVFINKNIETKCREDCRRRIVGRLHEVVAEAKAAGMVRKEIVDVIDVSMSSDSSPYSATPSQISALAKQKKSGK